MQKCSINEIPLEVLLQVFILKFTLPCNFQKETSDIFVGSWSVHFICLNIENIV